MNTNYSRFKINALIQMARTTENSEKRERYISQAEDALEEMDSGKYLSTPLEIFLDEKCEVGEEFRTERTEIFQKYLEFCEERKFKTSSRNVLYHFLRENGVGEFGTSGYRVFKLRIK